jgi:6-phosphofructokinase 1
MKIGILTGGGDCPGLNPAIRAATIRATDYGDEVIGIKRGWGGLLDLETTPLTWEALEDIISQGGTVLESSRTNPFKNEADAAKAVANFRQLGLDALIALGGEDTLGVAYKLHQQGLPVIGVPKTMDNDLSATDSTFGFQSAVTVAVDAADRLKDTARSHRRILVVEVMGRHAGWVALNTAISSGADWVLLPEVPFDAEAMCACLNKLRDRNKHWGLVVVSEGVELGDEDEKQLDAFGHVFLGDRGVGDRVAKIIEEGTGLETRSVTLGHIVRGGAPVPFDRVLASRVGIKAVELAHEGKFGMMAALQGTEVVGVPLEAAVGQLKVVPQALYDEVKTLFR